MVARPAALGNYDPSLYFHAPGSGRDGDVSGRSVGGGYGPGGHSAFADGDDWRRAVVPRVLAGGKSDYSRLARDRSRSK